MNKLKKAFQKELIIFTTLLFFSTAVSELIVREEQNFPWQFKNALPNGR